MTTKELKEYFDIQIYDKKYQDIECLGIIGYTSSYKTWDNIKDLIEWKGKKVADLGCFHGYFAFKAAKLGAIVTGLDISETVLKTTRYINEIEGNIISLKKWEGGDEVSLDYDVALCLNVLHHFTDKKKALENIKSKIAIFEVNINLLDIISEEFNVIKQIKSHRTDNSGMTRIILLCERKIK
jgi:2-polyprenyl-3-methyl-5-hydroxy-6-metoxy-1,4-benzoquinol methylase